MSGNQKNEQQIKVKRKANRVLAQFTVNCVKISGYTAMFFRCFTKGSSFNESLFAFLDKQKLQKVVSSHGKEFALARAN